MKAAIFNKTTCDIDIDQDFIWVSKCIASCVNNWQLNNAYELISLYKLKHGENDQMDILIKQYVQKQNFLII